MSERQLDILKGPRQRGVTRKDLATEFSLHCAIADTLRVSLNKGWLWYHPPNGGWRTKVEAAKFRRMGVRPGVPDIILIDMTGKHYYLELKTKYGKLTDEQAAFGLALIERNVPWRGAWSYEEAVDILREWGAVRVAL